MKEGLEELNILIEEQISRLTKGINIDTDIALLKDLKRLSELGVLTIYTDNTIPNLDFVDDTVSVTYKQPRLMFEGESKIVQLKDELQAYKENHIHTKEDVIEAYKRGALIGSNYTEDIFEKEAEGYYNHKFKNKEDERKV